jgi:hypothetical protein
VPARWTSLADQRLISVVRLVLLAALLLLTACGEREAGALTRGGPSPVPAATPTPDVAVRLMERVRNMTAVVRQVDRIAAARAKWGDILSRTGVQLNGADPNEDVWVIAVVGDVSPAAARGPVGAYQCATFVFDGQESPKSSTYSALSGCTPYFSDSLVPPAAAVACPPEPQAYAYDGHGPTLKGPVNADHLS